MSTALLPAFVEIVNECFDGAVPVDIAPDLNLKADLGIDSLRIVELIVKIEEKYQIVFHESDLNPDRLVKVSDLLELMAKGISGEKE